MRRFLFATGFAIAATVVLATTATFALATSKPKIWATTRCSDSELVTWLDTQGDGAAGSVYYNLQFTNLAHHKCAFRGYPGVSAVSLSGKQLGRAASRNPQHSPSTITLSPGTSAKAVLRITQAGNFPKSKCKPVTAAGLRVYAPNQTKATVIPYPFGACSARGVSFLSVEALEKT